MATVELKLRPWIAPNYATVERPPVKREDDMRELPSLHVSELTPEALTSLAEQWLTDLYAKAGKAQNWTFE